MPHERSAVTLTCPACHTSDAVGSLPRGLWYCWQCGSEGTLRLELDVTTHGIALVTIDETGWADDG